MALQQILTELYNLKLRQPSVLFIDKSIVIGYTQVLEPTDINILDIKRSKKVALHNAVKRALQDFGNVSLLDVDVIVIEGNYPIPNTAYMQLVLQNK